MFPGLFPEIIGDDNPINALPVDLQLLPGISVEELCRSRAVWHKSCRLKFATSKLERAQKFGKTRDQSSCEARKVRRQ